MPTYILKINDKRFEQDYYLEWSTVVDAPVTRGMSKQDFIDYYLAKHGMNEVEELTQRLKRVEKQGSSCLQDTNGIEHYFDFNRAGENEKTLGKEAILDRYCRGSAQPLTKNR